jgi:futalosine hydrolase
MYLLAAATDMELAPAKKSLGSHRGIDFLNTGVGPVNAVYSLTRYLTQKKEEVKGVINFGVTGAYLETGLNLLDICLAEKEILADLGICFAESIAPLSEETLSIQREFDLQNSLFKKAAHFLKSGDMSFKRGCFVTVNCVSGTQSRGDMLRKTYQALCENMEGAAIARVCTGFGIECLELRSVSNMVEDRNPSTWKLAEACKAAALHTAQMAEYFLEQ